MFEGIGVAWTVREQGLNTRAVGRCASACSMIFLAGVERQLDYAGTVGFHFPYVPDTKGLDWIKNNLGWFGVQDSMNRTSALFMAYLLYFGVDHDSISCYNLAESKEQKNCSGSITLTLESSAIRAESTRKGKTWNSFLKYSKSLRRYGQSARGTCNSQGHYALWQAQGFFQFQSRLPASNAGCCEWSLR